jgi:gluconate 2-dehydrogenase gamma chain
MNRREAIERTALILGYAISATAMAGVLSSCTAAPTVNYKPVFFTDEQAALMSEVAEIILPKTTTPGAKDVGVPQFIDTLIFETYSKEDKESFLKGLMEFDQQSTKVNSERFNDLDTEKQKAFVKAQHDIALTKPVGENSDAWWANGSAKAEKPFILKMKELTLLGFFTSEAGATRHGLLRFF